MTTLSTTDNRDREHFFVLEDCTVRDRPLGWAKAAINAMERWGADRIVAESNNGGEMVELTLKTVDPHAPVTLVHASRGKRTRAEPVSALYEQGKVTHVRQLEELEDQMCTWTPEDPDSPDRMDALVWAITALKSGGTFRIRELSA